MLCRTIFDDKKQEVGENQAKQEKEKNKAPAWRDYFRRLKSNRLAYHHLIDASELHTQELYVRELELKAKKLKGFSREWIEKWQLWFYRITSDHHTDLAKIDAVMLVALFGIFTCALSRAGSENSQQDLQGAMLVAPLQKNISVFGVLPQAKSFGLLYALLIVSWCLCLYIFKKHMSSLFKTIDWRFLIFYVLAIFICPLGEILLILASCLGFIFVYLGLLVSSASWPRTASYMVCLGILVFKPALLLPFFGKLFDESLKINFPAMQGLSVLYCIVMFLMLFSLQKTARKTPLRQIKKGLE